MYLSIRFTLRLKLNAKNIKEMHANHFIPSTATSLLLGPTNYDYRLLSDPTILQPLLEYTYIYKINNTISMAKIKITSNH